MVTAKYINYRVALLHFFLSSGDYVLLTTQKSCSALIRGCLSLSFSYLCLSFIALCRTPLIFILIIHYFYGYKKHIITLCIYLDFFLYIVLSLLKHLLDITTMLYVCISKLANVYKTKTGSRQVLY